MRPLRTRWVLTILVSTIGTLTAQELSVIGDADASISAALASSNGDLSALTGLRANEAVVSGAAHLDLRSHLDYDMGSFVADAALAWSPGPDGDVLTAAISQAYVTLAPSAQFSLDVGKRRLPWGSGYAFFPGDSFNPPADPTGGSGGAYGVIVSVVPSASVSISAAARLDTAFPELAGLTGFAAAADPGATFLAPYLTSAGNPWNDLRYALYADALIGTVDAHAAAVYQRDVTARPSLGLSFDVLGLIVDAEAALELGSGKLYRQNDGSYAAPEFGTPYPIASIGIQGSAMTDTLSFATTLEYEYDATAYDPAQARAFYDDATSYYLTLAAGTPAAGATSGEALAAYTIAIAGSEPGKLAIGGDYVPALGRHRLALSAALEADRLVRVTVAGLANLQDGSFALSPEIRLITLPGIDLFAHAQVAWGSSTKTEFGSVPVPFVFTCGATTHF